MDSYSNYRLYQRLEKTLQQLARNLELQAAKSSWPASQSVSMQQSSNNLYASPKVKIINPLGNFLLHDKSVVQYKKMLASLSLKPSRYQKPNLQIILLPIGKHIFSFKCSLELYSIYKKSSRCCSCRCCLPYQNWRCQYSQDV